jgi:hypothetical protein
VLRLGLAIVAGIAWMVTLPVTADALLNNRQTWASVALVPAAVAVAALWWIHMRERALRIGLAGRMSGWLFIGVVALVGVAGFLWLLVVMAVLASAIAYGVVLLVSQSRAANPRLDLVTGLILFATAGATAIFSVTTGLQDTESWWTPAHLILGIGLGAATVASGMPSGEGVREAPAPARARRR